MGSDFPKTATQQRFEMLINQLSPSVYALANRLSVSQSRIWRALEKQKGVDAELLDKIFQKFPEVNMDWVITGRGSMLLSGTETLEVKEPIESYNRPGDIRVVFKHQLSEYPRHCMDNGYIRKLPYAGGTPGESGRFRDFEMGSSNMSDSLGSGIIEGDILRTQLVPEDQWQKVLALGMLVVIVTQRSIYIRMVQSLDAETITLKSWNPLYQPETIKISDIRETWLYRGLTTTRDFKHKLYE
jgi:hypothetical protein